MNRAKLAELIERLRAEGVPASPAEHLLAGQALKALGRVERTGIQVALKSSLIKHRADLEVFDRCFDALFPGEPSEERDGKRSRGGKQGRGQGERRSPPDSEKRDPTRIARKQDTRSVQARMELEAQLGVSLAGISTEVLEADLTGFVSPELQGAVLEAIGRLLAHLVPRFSRRKRAHIRGRKLHAKSLFRRNLKHGGVPFLLTRRQRRTRPPRVVMVCDVSGSVRNMAGLLLRLCLGLESWFSSYAVFLFVNRPVPVSPRALGELLPPPEETQRVIMRKHARRAPAWGWRGEAIEGVDRFALSDFGSTFYHLDRDFGRRIDKETLLVILGDGRTNHFDPMPWAFESIARRARRTVWLVPEKRARWNTGDSALSVYAPWCDAMVEVISLVDLVVALNTMENTLGRKKSGRRERFSHR